MEVNSLKSRVRQLMTNPHWLTDGEWKESVVRQILRRQLPTTALVSRGFIVSGGGESTQIDVLIHDAAKPSLFKDGDLVFVTPDAVLGIIEVKSRIRAADSSDILGKLALNAALIRRHANARAFVSLFAFEADEEALAAFILAASQSAPTWNHRLDFAAIGESGFIKYWDLDPKKPTRLYNSWHSYDLYGRAAGYFFHNVVDAISPESVLRNSDVWFPATGKEPHRLEVRKGMWLERKKNPQVG